MFVICLYIVLKVQKPPAVLTPGSFTTTTPDPPAAPDPLLPPGEAPPPPPPPPRFVEPAVPAVTDDGF